MREAEHVNLQVLLWQFPLLQESNQVSNSHVDGYRYIFEVQVALCEVY
jgi:hypothetical protein